MDKKSLQPGMTTMNKRPTDGSTGVAAKKTCSPRQPRKFASCVVMFGFALLGQHQKPLTFF
jgi:hypothetical protein